MATEPTNTTPPVQRPTRNKEGRNTATRFNSNKYQQESKQYPLDLFSNKRQYGGNFMVFYINVMQDSKLMKEGTFGNSVENDNAELRSNIDQTAVSVGATAFSTAIAGGALGSIGNVATGVSGAVVGAAATGAVAAKTQNMKMSRQTKRLQSAIALYVPPRLQARYSVSWQEQDLGVLLGAAQLAQEAANIVKATEANNKSGSNGAGKNFASSAGNAAVALALGATGAAGDLLSAQSGLAYNPKKEQIFKGVDFRTFNFEYQFAPRDEKEAREVMDIIKQFKLHMHPEYDDKDNFLFIYPSEFDIYYYAGEDENMNLHRHTTCVLQEMTVDYTPNGAFSTFADGTPTQINMNLVFKELAILTKEQILDGF